MTLHELSFQTVEMRSQYIKMADFVGNWLFDSFFANFVEIIVFILRFRAQNLKFAREKNSGN